MDEVVELSGEHGEAVAVYAVIEQQAVPEVFSFKVGKSLIVHFATWS